MAAECKIMISFRLPRDLLKRVDFVAGNTPKDALATRSAVLLAAIESWLPAEEDALEKHLKKFGVAVRWRK